MSFHSNKDLLKNVENDNSTNTPYKDFVYVSIQG